MTLRSALYRGRVGHARLRPKAHQFEYRVFYGLFDIDELPQLDRRLRLFSFERFILFSLRSSDHGPDDGTSLRRWAERLLSDAGIDLGGGRIELLAFPRVLGYVFNPISVWYCYGPDSGLQAVMHEVRVSVTSSPRRCMSRRLWTWISPTDSRLLCPVTTFQSGSPSRTLMVPSSGYRFGPPGLEFTDRNLISLFVTHPLVTLKAIVAIHWEALRLWRKGLSYVPRPDPSPRNISVVSSLPTEEQL